MPESDGRVDDRAGHRLDVAELAPDELHARPGPVISVRSAPSRIVAGERAETFAIVPDFAAVEVTACQPAAVGQATAAPPSGRAAITGGRGRCRWRAS